MAADHTVQFSSVRAPVCKEKENKHISCLFGRRRKVSYGLGPFKRVNARWLGHRHGLKIVTYIQSLFLIINPRLFKQHTLNLNTLHAHTYSHSRAQRTSAFLIYLKYILPRFSRPTIQAVKWLTLEYRTTETIIVCNAIHSFVPKIYYSDALNWQVNVTKRISAHPFANLPMSQLGCCCPIFNAVMREYFCSHDKCFLVRLASTGRMHVCSLPWYTQRSR